MLKKISLGIIGASVLLSMPVQAAENFTTVSSAANALIAYADNNGLTEALTIYDDFGEYHVQNDAEVDEWYGYQVQSYKNQVTEKTKSPEIFCTTAVYQPCIRTINHVDTAGTKIADPTLQKGGREGKTVAITWDGLKLVQKITDKPMVDWPAYNTVPSSISKDWKIKTSVSAKVSPTKDETVNAVYERIDRSITFNANGGTGSMAKQTVKSGVSTALTANTLTRAGYSFNGWNTKADGTGTKYANKANITTSANTTLYAQWKPNTLTVNFYPGKATGDEKGSWDGKSAVMKMTVYNYDSTEMETYGLPNADGGTWNLTKKGYYVTDNFLVGSATATTKVSQNTKFAKVQDFAKAVGVDLTTGNKTINLYAEMLPNPYKVKFNANGGTGTMSDQSLKYDTASNLTANVFKKTGYSFTGWSGNGTTYADKASVKNLTDVKNGTVELNAQWKINAYNVVFDGNGSTSGSTASLTNKNYNTTQTLTANGFKRAGYSFNGWNTKADGTGTSYADKASFKIPVGNTTLYAQWKANNYTVSFNGNGGSGSTASMSKAYNTTNTLTANGFSKTGYSFTGWNTKADGSGTSYANKASFKIPASNTTLYAQWKINTYNVTFNANGGTGTMNALTGKEYNSKQTLPSNSFKKEGYTFAGWNTKANGSGTSYSGTITIPANNTTLYAQWKINQHTVTFTDGLGKNISQVKVDNGKAATAPTNPTRTGYTFAGWDKDFSNITGDLTVNAKWTVNKYTVSFTDGEGKVLKKETVEHGKAATAPNNPTSKGRDFVAWDKAFNNVTGNLTVSAKWEDIITSDWYTIQTKKAPTYRLGTPNTKDDIRIQSSNNKTGQKFKIQRMSDGTYKLATGSTVGNKVFAQGGGQVAYNSSDAACKWEVVENSDGSFSFKNEETKKFISYETVKEDVKITESSTNDTANQRFVIKPFSEKYTVVFKDGEDVLDRQSVKKGEAAVAPKTNKQGKSITKWDVDFSKVTKNIVVTAI